MDAPSYKHSSNFSSRAIGGMPTHYQPTVWIAATFITILATQTELSAEQPQVRFDAPTLVAFEPVQPQTDSVRLAAGRKLIEVKLDVSVWLANGKPEQLEEIMIEVVDLSGRARVLDFMPRDESQSEYAGNISVEKKTEKDMSLSLAANSTFDWVVRADGQAVAGKKNTDITRYEKKAPTQQVIVSGTTRQGRGVSFRFRRSTETPLEGTHSLTLLLSVPDSYNLSLLRLECLATGHHGVGLFQQDSQAGRDHFLVPTFARMEPEAQLRSETFAHQLRRLKHVARTQQTATRSRSYSDPLQRVGILLNVAKPDIPDQWLERLTLDANQDEFESYAHQLPDEVRQAGEDYLLARRTLFMPTH